MCGICGVYDVRSAAAVDLVLRMMRSLRHRGPDGGGYYRDARVALGHVRLAIIDEAGGSQPMCGEDERVWVTFNGEIFNYIELAEQLTALGHRFRTRCDTEVIVHAWEEWGTECFGRFNGQWAAAIWDRRASELVLSRDRYGIHPLFYTKSNGRVLFASEVKALFCDPRVRRALDPVGVDQLLTFWSTVAPDTPFEGVRQVPPGCCVTFRGERESLAEYWRPRFPERHDEPDQDAAENAEHLRASVVEATKLRFARSDVPVGAYLSGGLDSAVTASTIARYADRDVHTFSLRFAKEEYDEGTFQRLARAGLRGPHEDIVVSERDIAEALPSAVWHAESAFLRSAPVPMLLLSRLVRQAGYKVVVTGEGADEVLAGYDIFREAKVRRFIARNRQSAQRARAIGLLYPWMFRSPNHAPAFARSFFGIDLDPDDPAMSHRPRWGATSALKSMLTTDYATAPMPAAADTLLAAMPSESAHWDPLSQAQWLELRTLLSGYLLSSQGDRMLMANAVEGRFPFLDHHVFDIAARFPARQKLLGLDEKHLLKRAFADLIPRAIIDRSKQPYRAPDASGLFASNTPAWVDELTSARAIEEAGVFRPEVARAVIQKCLRSDRPLSNTDDMRAMAVLTLQLLHHQFVTDWTAPPADQNKLDVAIDRSEEDAQ